ncbi:MAG: hypothetical protein ACPLWC_05205, partial [Candidatus Woesearchaeota archaeon]
FYEATPYYNGYCPDGGVCYYIKSTTECYSPYPTTYPTPTHSSSVTTSQRYAAYFYDENGNLVIDAE